MRPKLDPRVLLGRIRLPPYHRGDDHNGAFLITGPAKRKLLLIVSKDQGWEHVSISVYRTKLTPTWEEMCFVKELIFDPEECVVQYHPPKSQYVNTHPGVLHLWRPEDQVVPMPPIEFV